MVINNGFNRLLHQNCHHHIIFVKISLKICYPIHLKRLVWDNKEANTDTINLAIKSFNRKNIFNHKDINSQMKIFNKTIMNIFSNFIPNKMKAIRDSNPPWMNDDIKSKVKLKNELYHRFLSVKRNNEGFGKLEYLRNEIDNLISRSKKEHYQDINRTLTDTLTSSNTYSSIMKTFFNGKKVLVILPKLFNGAFVTDFQEKKYFQFLFCKTIYINFK